MFVCFVLIERHSHTRPTATSDSFSSLLYRPSPHSSSSSSSSHHLLQLGQTLPPLSISLPPASLTHLSVTIAQPFPQSSPVYLPPFLPPFSLSSGVRQRVTHQRKGNTSIQRATLKRVLMFRWRGRRGFMEDWRKVIRWREKKLVTNKELGEEQKMTLRNELNSKKKMKKIECISLLVCKKENKVSKMTINRKLLS